MKAEITGEEFRLTMTSAEAEMLKEYIIDCFLAEQPERTKQRICYDADGLYWTIRMKLAEANTGDY